MRTALFLAELARQRPDLEIRRSGGDGHLVIRDPVRRQNLVIHACYKEVDRGTIERARKRFGVTV